MVLEVAYHSVQILSLLISFKWMGKAEKVVTAVQIKSNCKSTAKGCVPRRFTTCNTFERLNLLVHK